MSSTAIDRRTLLQPLEHLAASSARYALLGEYPDLPDRFEGRDIDLVVDDVGSAAQAFASAKWVIRHGDRSRVRAFHLASVGATWVTVDMIEPAAISQPSILWATLDTSCRDNTGLYRPPSSHLLAWQTVKRLQLAAFHRRQQLREIAEKWRQADPADLALCEQLLADQQLNPLLRHLLVLVVSGEMPSEAFAIEAENVLAPKRQQRERERVVRDGSIKFRGFVRNRPIVLRFVGGRLGPAAPPLLTIALVGNDGSGKSLIATQLKREVLQKADPVHLVMRRNSPIMSPWRLVRRPLKDWTAFMRSRDRHSPQRWVQWITDIGDYIDRRIRFSLGRRWAGAGLGMVIFERYPTDRIRGEFDRSRQRLYPLEQFFPMPDLIVLLDVDPETSLSRKPEDGHTTSELRAKRTNYLRLVSEISPHLLVDGSRPVSEVLEIISRNVWHHCRRLQQEAPNDYPARWRPAGGGHTRWTPKLTWRNCRDR